MTIGKYLKKKVLRHRLILNATFTLLISYSIYLTCCLVLMLLHTIAHQMIKVMLYIYILHACILRFYQNACASNLSGSKLIDYESLKTNGGQFVTNDSLSISPYYKYYYLFMYRYI